MQMQPINPQAPLGPGARDTRAERGGNFMDSLLSVHSKEDSTSIREPDSKTNQDDKLAPETPPETGAADTPPMPVAVSGGQNTAAAGERQPPTMDEQPPSAAEGAIPALAVPAVHQLQPRIMIAEPDGQRPEKADLTSRPTGFFLAQAVIENQNPTTDGARPQSSVAEQTLANPLPFRVSTPATLPGNGPDPSAVTITEGLPEQANTPLHKVAEIINLKVQHDLPPASHQPTEWPAHAITVIADHLNTRNKNAASAMDLRLAELMQNKATGEPGQTAVPADTATDLTEARFAEIFGRTTGPTPETASVLVPLRQRNNWTAGRTEATATGHIGQETEAGSTVLKISEQFMAENKTDSPAKDILWARLASIDPAPPHLSESGETADLTTASVPAPETSAGGVTNQASAATRLPQGIAMAEHRIVDNVIQQVSLHAKHDQQNSISIRLYPEELGHLKMDLLANNENIKAHIHVQTQMTQEILEKHLHRLREGFAQQGLNLDEIQVSVSSDMSSGPGLFNGQRTLHARPPQANILRPGEPHETVMVETAGTPFRSDGSFSLRI
jgi:flagellar hook-length control protein FliK